MKRKYVTLIDRTWKGKEWFSSFGKSKFVRTLTDEEASQLDMIKEVVEELKPFDVGVVGTIDGRMFCTKCGSRKGFYSYKMYRGTQSSWYTIYKCAECGAREKKQYK